MTTTTAAQQLREIIGRGIFPSQVHDLMNGQQDWRADAAVQWAIESGRTFVDAADVVIAFRAAHA